MSQKRYGVDQIIPMWRRADVELGKEKKVPEVCKRLGIAGQTYCRWRPKYGGMASEMAKELKALQQRECSAEEDGGRAGSRHGDFEGSHEGDTRERPFTLVCTGISLFQSG